MVDDVDRRDLDQCQAVCFHKNHLEHRDLCLLVDIGQWRRENENVFEVEAAGGHFLLNEISCFESLLPGTIRGIWEMLGGRDHRRLSALMLGGVRIDLLF